MNAEPQKGLFRREVLEHRADRLHGEVSIAVPVSWQVIGYSLLASLGAALAFLAMASYSRVESVDGAIALDKGVASIVPSRSGVIAALPVREGQQVAAGSVLAEIRSEENLARGASAPERIRDSVAEQDRGLAMQSRLLLSAAQSEQSRLLAQIDGYGQELASLDEQISAQHRLITVAERDFEQVRGIADSGFISRRDLDAREAALLARRQQLAQLQQARAAKAAGLVEARRGIAQAGATAQAQAAAVGSSRAQLAQQLAQAESARGYVLTSPVAGRVTAVTARLGQAVSQEVPLLIVVPQDSVMRAELHVPTSASGFLAIGQEMRLAVHAFPYQRFGTVQARIVELSSVAVRKAGPDGSDTSYYLVTASLDRPWIMAFGRHQPLLPGMALSARIVTTKQTLLEWLFEPLLAVRTR